MGRAVQRKVFHVEQMFTANRVSALSVAVDEIKPSHTPDEPREVLSDATIQTLKRELALVHDIIARNKRELSALIGDGKDRPMARAAGELGAAVEGMEKATDKILKSSEAIDDNAKAFAATLKNDYERGLAQDIQDHVVEIYEACNFQDLSGQRIGKVIDTLNGIEERVAAMLARCNALARPGVSPATPEAPAGRGLINGPRLDGDGGHASQRDIDAMFG
jgi:chemotaxis protein CheZ